MNSVIIKPIISGPTSRCWWPSTFTTQGCSNNQGDGDPEMIYLNPIEQTIASVTLNSMQPATGTNIDEHYINAVVPNIPSVINSFKIDGVAIASFTPCNAK